MTGPRSDGGDEAPLAGTLVLDFGQFLAGPVAALRLADLGARVVKIERPGAGDAGRALSFADLRPDGDGLTFHIMNRRKESVAADLKDPGDHRLVMALIARADVLIHNFRPGVMERLGLDHAAVRAVNPAIVYATVSGYGPGGPWASKPGQDLLAQARSGLMWMNGPDGGPPVPVGVSVADHLAAQSLTQAILAALLRRQRTGRGARVETSLLEAIVDLQFEAVSARLTAPGVSARRAARFGAHPYLPAPYGVYATADGYVALAMNPMDRVLALLGLPGPAAADAAADAWALREALNGAIGSRLAEHATEHWLSVLEPAGIWCAPVLTLEEMLASEAFSALDMVQETVRPARDGGGTVSVRATRPPFRIDGVRPASAAGAPHVGEDTDRLRAEVGLPAAGGSR